MSMNRPDIGQLQQRALTSLHDHWVLFLVEGIVLVVLGIVAIVFPPVATLAVAIFLGWLFLISGIVGLATTYMMRQAPGFWWSLLSAALAVLVGGILLARPVVGAVSLTFVLITFFVIEGIASIMLALQHRQSRSWVWLLASGVVDLILGGLILVGLPGTAAWALGLLVGINMLFGGVSLIAMALHARGVDPRTTPPRP
jgi:uncharacterized membrane protein HdeD (DUF308 family)